MKITVFGITGTNGKTTSTYMLRSILNAKGEKAGVIGTISHSTVTQVHDAINTTPSNKLLKEYFSEMEAENVENCIMEVSSHGIAQNRIADIEFQFGGFTNLTRDHLDYHKDMEEYFQVKKGFLKTTTKANVINIDDEYGKRIYDEFKGNCSQKLYSMSEKDKNANIYAEIREENLEGTKAEFFINGESMGEIHISIPGKYFVYNALMAVGLAVANQIAQDEENGNTTPAPAKEKYEYIRKGIENLEGVPGRFEVIKDNKKDTITIVDYAHSPDALETLLTEVKRLAGGRTIALFGCGGDRDKGKRPIMGEIAGRISDFCIITSDNPRSEDPDTIINEIEVGVKKTECPYIKITDRHKAIEKALAMAEKHDVIVVAGKGHEKYPFNDREAVEEILCKGLQ